MKRHWFPALALVALAPLGAPLLAPRHPLAALLIHDFFSRLCHQNPGRSFLLDGSPVAVCARCLGIYLGVAGGALLNLRQRDALLWLAVGAMLNGAEAASELIWRHGNWPVERFLLGCLLGAGAGAALFCRPGSLSRQFSG